MKQLRKQIFMAVAGLLLAGQPCWAKESIKIVTTTTVLASLAEEIVGEGSKVHYVASPKRDMHHVAPTPKDVLKVRKADVVIYHGLQAEPWLLPLLNAAGRNEFLSLDGNSIDASSGVQPLEVPHDVNRLEGDVHPHGNPHYWLDPHLAKVMANNISQSLSRIYPDLSKMFKANNRSFQKKLDVKLVDWERRMRPFAGLPVVTYHRSWSYFAEAYDLHIVGEIEPKPGIPVTSRHLSDLKTIMMEQDVKLIITEPYQNEKPSKKLSKETGAAVVELVQFNGAKKGVDDYISLFEYIVSQIETALS